jgi:hypothetical protein
MQRVLFCLQCKKSGQSECKQCCGCRRFYCSFLCYEEHTCWRINNDSSEVVRQSSENDTDDFMHVARSQVVRRSRTHSEVTICNSPNKFT